MAPQLAYGHVLDHALTQRADGAIGTHGELLLSEVLRPRSFLRTGLPAPTMVSSRLATNPRSGTPRSGLSRQRFSALAHSAIRQDPRALVRCWGLSGRISNGLSRVVFRQHVTLRRPRPEPSSAPQHCLSAMH